MGVEHRRSATTEELLLESRDLIDRLSDQLRAREHLEHPWPTDGTEAVHRLVASVEATSGYRAECACGWSSWPCATSLGVIDEWACHCIESDLTE